MSGYAPVNRPRSESEIKDLKEGAANLRAQAERCAQAGDPDRAERLRISADQNIADAAASTRHKR